MGTRQQCVAEAAPPEQEEARFATFGDTEGEEALGYKSGKALSLRVCTRAMDEILPVQKLPGEKDPRGHAVSCSQIYLQAKEQGEQPFSCQTFLSRLCHIRFHIHLS